MKLALRDGAATARQKRQAGASETARIDTHIILAGRKYPVLPSNVKT